MGTRTMNISSNVIPFSQSALARQPQGGAQQATDAPTPSGPAEGAKGPGGAGGPPPGGPPPGGDADSSTADSESLFLSLFTTESTETSETSTESSIVQTLYAQMQDALGAI